jgi:hypothetical protein
VGGHAARSTTWVTVTRHGLHLLLLRTGQCGAGRRPWILLLLLLLLLLELGRASCGLLLELGRASCGLLLELGRASGSVPAAKSVRRS